MSLVVRLGLFQSVVVRVLCTVEDPDASSMLAMLANASGAQQHTSRLVYSELDHCHLTSQPDLSAIFLQRVQRWSL